MTEPPPPEIDLMTDRPHSARIYDYYLGGKTNYAVDREVGDIAIASFPPIRTSARANRAFMRRAVRHLAEEHGIRQFLDLGTGIPTSPNLHEVAQAVHPDARVVYVDNDPIVLAHARALLYGTRVGRTAYLDADIRVPGAVAEAPELRETLDLTQPVALTAFAIVHFIEDDDIAYPLISQLMDLLPSGSFLALTSGTDEFATTTNTTGSDAYRKKGIPITTRRTPAVERFFTGLELLDPGVTRVHRWQPEHELGTESGAALDELVHLIGGVGRKP
ncbi:SAM-dependent methyltransferase [Pseudonocardia sp. TRM90224]|uniref:SAM-dependent methyltransferase n=1 Tax=Pseudonocardia sp. TRM90224 TaxID=2812678 RepID=UPI001E466AE9|nr:SAM-dependent methyltransferase [Pseudonocardia sp. TRM90224]